MSKAEQVKKSRRLFRFRRLGGAAEAGKAVPPKRRKPARLVRLSLRDQILFVRRLSILLKAGVPLFESIRMMRKHLSSRGAVALVEELAEGVERGQFLYTSLERYRRQLGEFALNVIRIGEVSGTLSDNLAYLADELEKRRQLRNKVRSALVYPSIIVVATVGIVILLTVYIFPKILPILQGFRGELPLATRVLIRTSAFVSEAGVYLAGAAIGVFIGGMLLRRMPTIRYALDMVALSMPLFGTLFQYYHIVNFCRTFGILLRSGIPILEAVQVTADTSINLVYRKSLAGLVEVVRGGGKISSYFEKWEWLYPPMVAQMVTVGEVSGRLSESLLYVADTYEREIDDLTKNLSSSIEPLLMVVMGLIVGFVAVSIIMPIYQLTQSLRP